MNSSTQIINTSSFKVSKTQVDNIKTSRPIAGVKPLTSRYAQGYYNPAEEQKQKLATLPSTYARKHSLENSKEQAVQSTKRVKMHADAKVSTTSRVPLSTNNSTNIVAAAKLSLKEKQLLKEKRIRKTGAVKLKSAAIPLKNQSIPPISKSNFVSNTYNFNNSSVENAKLKQTNTELVRVSSRRDSRYSSDENNSSCIQDKLGDISGMQIDADLLPVQITTMNSTTISKPKIIHVARASSRVSAIEKKLEVNEKKPRSVLAAIPLQSVKKTSSIANSRVPTLNTSLKDSTNIELKISKANLSSCKSVSVTKELSIPKSIIPALQKSAKKPRKKAVIVQDPIQALEYSEDIYVYWREIEVILCQSHCIFVD